MGGTTLYYTHQIPWVLNSVKVEVTWEIALAWQAAISGDLQYTA